MLQPEPQAPGMHLVGELLLWMSLQVTIERHKGWVPPKAEDQLSVVLALLLECQLKGSVQTEDIQVPHSSPLKFTDAAHTSYLGVSQT